MWRPAEFVQSNQNLYKIDNQDWLSNRVRNWEQQNNTFLYSNSGHVHTSNNNEFNLMEFNEIYHTKIT